MRVSCSFILDGYFEVAKLYSWMGDHNGNCRVHKKSMPRDSIVQDWDLLLRGWGDTLRALLILRYPSCLATHNVIWSQRYWNKEMRKQNKTGSGDNSVLWSSNCFTGIVIKISHRIFLSIAKQKELSTQRKGSPDKYLYVYVGINMGI